jgi:hypothetical protein
VERKEVHSLKELKRDAAGILERVNRDQALTRAAFVNPILALEELGYDIAADFRPSLEYRMRFSLEQFRRLERLQRDIFAAAGHPFALNDPPALYQVLFEELGLPVPHERHGCSEQGLITQPLPPHIFGRAPAPDPLHALAGKHPIIAPLLEYRLLESSEPRFAPRDLYEAVKTGRRGKFVTRLEARLKQVLHNGGPDEPPA